MLSHPESGAISMPYCMLLQSTMDNNTDILEVLSPKEQIVQFVRRGTWLKYSVVKWLVICLQCSYFIFLSFAHFEENINSHHSHEQHVAT